MSTESAARLLTSDAQKGRFPLARVDTSTRPVCHGTARAFAAVTILQILTHRTEHRVSPRAAAGKRAKKGLQRRRPRSGWPRRRPGPQAPIRVGRVSRAHCHGLWKTDRRTSFQRAVMLAFHRRRERLHPGRKRPRGTRAVSLLRTSRFLSFLFLFFVL